MGKPDPYGEWVLFGNIQDEGREPLAVDEDLLAAAREAWPHMLAHVRGELGAKEFGSERRALAAEVWDGVLRSVAKTRQRDKDHRPPISDLQSYLIGAFHHRFNRALQQEQKRCSKGLSLFRPASILSSIESAQDAGWVEELERAITVRQITNRMDGWTRKVWQARQFGYSWKEISLWLGVSEKIKRERSSTTEWRRLVKASFDC